MNIFYLDKNPEQAAKWHNDSHVRKMILELAQLLSTAHRVLDGEEYYDLSKTGRRVKRWRLDNTGENIFYKATHVNHPCAKWVRESADHYNWTYQLFKALCGEFEYRWSKTHATWNKLGLVLEKLPKNIEFIVWTDPPQAMDDQYRLNDAVEAYHNYYIHGKSHLARWTGRDKPDWYLTE